jgi:hypothetical protein
VKGRPEGRVRRAFAGRSPAEESHASCAQAERRAAALGAGCWLLEAHPRSAAVSLQQRGERGARVGRREPVEGLHGGMYLGERDDAALAGEAVDPSERPEPRTPDRRPAASAAAPARRPPGGRHSGAGAPSWAASARSRRARMTGSGQRDRRCSVQANEAVRLIDAMARTTVSICIESWERRSVRRGIRSGRDTPRSRRVSTQ